MKIVILDGHTLNPGDLSWDALCRLGTCEIYARTPPGHVVERPAARGGADQQGVDRPRRDRSHPDLRADRGHRNRLQHGGHRRRPARGVLVCNVPEYGTPNVAQAVFALLLELTNRTGHHARPCGTAAGARPRTSATGISR